MLKKEIKPENCIFAIGIPTSKQEFFSDLRKDNKDFARMVMKTQKLERKNPWKKYEKDIIRVIEKVEPVMKELGVTVLHNLTFKNFINILQERKADVIILLTHWKSEHNCTCFPKQGYIDFLEEHPDFLEFIVNSSEILEWIARSSTILRPLAEVKLSKQNMEKQIPLVEINNEQVYAKYDEIVYDHLKELSTQTYLDLLKNTHTSKVEFYDGLETVYNITTQVPVDFNGLISLDICRVRDLAISLRKCRPRCDVNYKFDETENKNSNGVIPRFMLFFHQALFIHLKRNKLTYLEAFEEVSSEFLKGVRNKRRKA